MLTATLFLLAGGASALSHQCSKDFESKTLLSVFRAMSECGTPTSLLNSACYDRRVRKSLRSYSKIGYDMATWERETSTSFESLKYMQHFGADIGESLWDSIADALEENHEICWYVPDCSTDKHSDSFSGHLGSVFFIDGPLREPLLHAATDTRKVDVRQGNHCFTPDPVFKPSRIEAIETLLKDYNNERVVSSPNAKTYRQITRRVSTDLLLSATLARLIRSYRCAPKINCTSELVEGRPYLPEDSKDFLRKVLTVIERDGMLCFQEKPTPFHVEEWYYVTGFKYRYS
ncbi:hypothetical protein CP533_5123 [Ophiocordyceps camponoti-saundersi (nom. inval.)]|nr:hypothetical protein CP533_5123 [Ophiocordyceps camponoti-saundersi (nom. inval.)]